MESAGFTLFQGGNSLKIDTSLNRLEEEEALEDQKRRNEELGNELQYAFDDLIGDDEYTVDSSLNLANELKECSAQSNNIDILNNKQKTEKKPGDYVNYRDEIKKLETVIESKNRELKHISNIVHEERKKNDELKKRLALSEAEKERAYIQKQQTYELLVESKTQVSELEDSISKLKTKIKNLEDSNNNLVGDLERTRTMLVDCQQKYHLFEKTTGLNVEKQTDAVLKQVNERHNAQMQMMQSQIDNLKSKLEDKESEVRNLETKYKELQCSKEALLIDKAETINQLARSLEDSQRQCQQLIAKQDFSEENIRLQKHIKALENQIEEMQKTINNLTARLESTTAELDLMDSVLYENGENSPRRFSQTKGNIIGSTPLTVSDRITKLKNELYRSITSQKEKREEIRRLQEQLSSKNEEIKKLKDEENKALVEIEMYKDEKLRLERKLQTFERELNETKTKSTDMQWKVQKNVEELKNRNEILNAELKRAQGESKDLHDKNQQLMKDIEELLIKLKCYENVQNEKMNLVSTLKSLSKELDEVRTENERLKTSFEIISNENDRLKKGAEVPDVLTLQLEKYKFLLKDAQDECNRVKNLYVEVSNAKEALEVELEMLKSQNIDKELQRFKDKYTQIEKALQLSELKCNEIQKLLESQKSVYEKKIFDLKSQLENEKLNSTKSRKNSLNSCTKCLNNLAEISKHEIENLKLQNQCSEYLKTQIDLQNRLQQTQITINDLTEKLTVKDESDKIISELKVKAKQFEEFIRNQSNSNGSSSGISSPKQQIQFDDKSVETTPDLEEKSTTATRRRIETEIRNEMAKIFALEIKRVERDFQNNIITLEQQNNELKGDLHKINVDLKQRQNEVQILKHAILSERQKMLDMMKANDKEAKEVIEKHSEMLNKCRSELQAKAGQVDDMMKDLDERNVQIESERRSMKAVMTQWEEQRNKMNREIENLKKIIKEHEKVVEQLQMKYNSAKKTAANYKKYAEDKEKHMLSEYERIKSGYETSLTNIEKRMKEILEKRENNTKKRIQEIELNCNEKLNQLRKQLEGNKIS